MTLANVSQLVLVGAGKMGGALLEGWLAHGLEPASVIIVDPTPAPEIAELASRRGIKMLATGAGLGVPEVVVLAVKPQIMGTLLPGLSAQLAPQFAPQLASAVRPTFLSIAAGQTIADIEKGLGGDFAVVRAMPNTPASVGAGISVLVANERAASSRHLCTALMAAVGAVEWIDDEALLDAVTAVSGSGPAYVFHLAEALAQGAEDAGLPPDLAARLARQTIIGAGALLKESPLDAAQLRENVTSKGGTTAAALGVLMQDDGLGRLLTRAVAAATARARELSA